MTGSARASRRVDVPAEDTVSTGSPARPKARFASASMAYACPISAARPSPPARCLPSYPIRPASRTRGVRGDRCPRGAPVDDEHGRREGRCVHRRVSTRPGGRGTTIGYAAPRHASTVRARSSGPVTTPASPSPAERPQHGPARHGPAPHGPAPPDPAPPDPAPPSPTPGRRGWGAVSIVLVGAFMALLDVTIVNVALPSIRT